MYRLKKKIAVILAVIMFMSSCNIYATVQQPHKGEKSAEVSYNNAPDDPRVKIAFDKIQDAAEVDPKTAGYVIEYQSTSKYDKTIYRSTEVDSANTITLGENGTLQEEGSLKPGQLYKYWVRPYHIHTIDEKPVPEYADLDQCTPGYFFTEFHVDAQLKKDEKGNKQIQIITQYIPNAIYEIYYARSRVNEIDTEKTSKLTEISSDKYEDGKGNVVYTLENPEMGTEYSFYIKLKSVGKGDIFKGDFDKVANTTQKTTEPEIAYVKVGTSVEVSSVGKDYIRFSSKFSDSYKTKIKYVEIVELSDTNDRKVIGEINKSQFHFSNEEKVYYMDFTYNRPDKTTNYLAIFYYEDGTEPDGDDIPDDILTYTPPDEDSVPMRPQVPEPANEEIVKNINKGTQSNYEQYFLKDDVILKDKKLNTINIKDTFHGYKDEKLGIQFVWSGQLKKNEKIQDPNIDYDIWMFKDNVPDDYYDYTPLKLSSTREEIYNDKEEVIGFKQKIEKYIDGNNEKDIVANSTYYIVIRSKNINYESKYSDATIVAITIDKDGEISQPSVLGKPPLRVQEENVTTDTIPIEWTKSWYELKAKDISQYSNLSATEQELAKQWNSGAYVNNGTPALRWTGNSEDRVGPFDSNFAKEYSNKGYSSRKVTLEDDIKYEVKAISYDEVLEKVIKMGDMNKENYLVGNSQYATTQGALRVENWINDYENKSQSDESFSLGWQEVTPTQKGSDKDWWQTSLSSYTDMSGATKSLEANKRYIIMVRTYRIVNQGNGEERLYQQFPSYVIGMTKTDYTAPDVIPNAPILYPNGVTDNSVSVWWLYNKDFEYEIRYSRLEDPESAEVWNFEISNNPDDKNYVANGTKATVTITGLSPETVYNVWIKAKGKGGESSWSNGVAQKTNTLDNPDAPGGLGLASSVSLLEVGKDMSASSSDYLVVEWLKIDADTNNKDENKSYGYTVEFADNEKFMDSVIVNTGEDKKDSNNQNTDSDATTENEDKEQISTDIFAKNIVQFKGLTANKDYYVKVKTVLNYTDPNSNKVIIKESEFTAVVRLKTKTSNSEYDGGENPNVVEYETPVIETFKNDIWTYEMVDAAKITTQILNNKGYNYTVTLKNYKGKYDALTRRIKMPVKIMSALSNQGMNLQVVTNIGTYQIPAEALKSYLQQYAGADALQIDLTRKSSTDIATYIRPLPDNYVAGEELQILFRSEGKSTKVNTLNEPMTVKLNSEAPGNYNYENLFTYSYNYAKGDWDTYQYKVDTENNKLLTFTTSYPGLNALYSRSISDSSLNSTYVMNALSSNYNIMGLGDVYAQDSPVMGSQYVTLMLGVARKTQNINLVQGASEADYKAASSAGLYNGNGGNVTREQALAGVVKLYEVKHGDRIKASKMTFPGVSASYSEAVSKAYAAGLIDEMTAPKANVTYAELCDWIALAIE